MAEGEEGSAVGKKRAASANSSTSKPCSGVGNEYLGLTKWVRSLDYSNSIN